MLVVDVRADVCWRLIFFSKLSGHYFFGLKKELHTIGVKPLESNGIL